MLEAGTSNYNYKSNTTVEVEGVASHLVCSETRRNHGLRFGGEAGPT